jgi:hypothetical protein
LNVENSQGFGGKQQHMYTIIATFNKLIGVLVPRVESSVKFFNVIDTPLEIDAPIGLGIVFINTNDCGKQTYC